jgi:PAS domain S-box-containing protein
MSEPKTSPRNNGEKGTTGSFRFEQQILNTSSIGVLITRINDGTILYANKAISSLLGNSNADSIVGQPVPDFYWDSTDREKLLELFRAEGSVTSKETRARQADGNMIWVSISLQPFEFEGEQVLLSEIIDISERKHVENEVKESQQKLALLIDSSPLAVIEWNTNFEVVSWNLAAERIFGYTAAEAKGKHARFIIPPEFHMYVDQVWEGLITQTGGARATNANVTKNGQAITCEWYNSPLAGADGKVFGVSSLVEDVTERKQAEDTVKESQQKLSLLIDSSPLAFIEWDMNFEVVSWNPSAERIFGYTAAEAKGKHARFIIPPEFHMYVDQVWEGLITQTGGTRATNANVTKNGQAITSEWYNTPLVGTDGKVLGVSSLVEDITERKQAEEELQRIQIIAETVPDFIAIASPDRSVLYVNSAGLEITGKTAEEVSKGIKIEDFQPTLSPEALKAVETEGIWKGESELVRKDGSFLPVSQVIATSKDSEGNVQYITTLARDITERKLAEEKLLQLQSAVEQTGDGIALADLNGNILYVNPAWAEVHGYTVAEILGQHLSIFHTPQQLEQEVIPFNNRVMSEGKSTSEVGHARKDGTIFPTLMTTVVQKDENGNPVGLIGTIRDITENKKAEELLQQSETNLSSALRVAQMGYWEFDVPTQTFTFNDQY